jgi:hypothetical protein
MCCQPATALCLLTQVHTAGSSTQMSAFCVSVVQFSAAAPAAAAAAYAEY